MILYEPIRVVYVLIVGYLSMGVVVMDKGMRRNRIWDDGEGLVFYIIFCLGVVLWVPFAWLWGFLPVPHVLEWKIPMRYRRKP